MDLGAGTARTIQVNSGVAVVSGQLSNTGSLTKSGAGELQLTNANTYTGSTSVIGGTLTVSNDNNMGAAGGTIIFANGAALRLAATVNSARNVTLPAGGGLIDATAGTDSVFSGKVSSTGTGTLTKNGAGSLTLTGANNYTGLTQVNAGTLTLGVNAWTPVLTTATGGANITTGRLVFDYTGGSSPATTIASLLKTSHDNAGFNNSERLRSTTADGNKGLGWVDNGTSKVTVGYVYYGDGDVSGSVDLTDFTFLAANFNKVGGATWLQGDYNYDGNVDLTDFTFLASNFNKSLPLAASAASGIGSVVPEPASMISILAAAGAVMMKRRRRA
jgi:fibronectin-binding autotransporter adhesin